MAVRINPRTINQSIERKILLNLITNKDYAKQIIPTLENGTFEIPYCSILARYVIEFFNQYQDVPNKTIQAIFNVKKNKLQPEDSELIEDFLLSLSSEYIEDGEENKVNTQYLVQTSLDYIKQRHFAILGEKLLAFSKLGDIKECEKTLLDDKQISGSQVLYVNLHDEEVVQRIQENKEKNVLFTIDGILGELVGPIKRGTLLGVQGRTGLGKSWILREFLLQALLKKLNCFEINLEMGIESISDRHYKRILGLGDKEGIYNIPVFDCVLNVNGLCRKPERKSKVKLMNNLGEMPKFGEEHDSSYVPCDVCRLKNKDYQFSTWYEPTYKRAIDTKTIKGGVRGFKLLFGDRLRTVVFPAGSASVKDCFHQIDMAEYHEGIIPDFSTWDYDELLANTKGFTNPLDMIDDNYKTLRGELQRRGMAGVIGMQTNRLGGQKKKSSIYDTSGSFKKMMHLDLALLLDQTPKEKEYGILNISVGKMRDGDFQISRTVKLLNNLAIGQSYLDSTWGVLEDESFD